MQNAVQIFSKMSLVILHHRFLHFSSIFHLKYLIWTNRHYWTFPSPPKCPLPKPPLPDPAHTLQRYLDYARVIAENSGPGRTEVDLGRTERCVEAFRPMAQKLQAKLTEIAENSDNWVILCGSNDTRNRSDHWSDQWVLASRDVSPSTDTFATELQPGLYLPSATFSLRAGPTWVSTTASKIQVYIPSLKLCSLARPWSSWLQRASGQVNLINWSTSM